MISRIPQKSTTAKGDQDRVAIFLGPDSALNVQRTIIGFGEILSEQFTLDLITTNPDALPDEIDSFYNIYGSKSAATFRGGYRALDSYLETTDPIALTYIIRPPTTGTIAALLAKRHDVPFVYRHSGETFRDYTLFNGYSKARLFALKNIVGRVPLKLATKYISLGPAGKYQLVDQGVSASDIHILPPPVDVDRLRNSAESIPFEIPTDAPLVLFVGRKSRLKGIRSLEAAIPDILERRPEMCFMFVGGGDDISVPPRCESSTYEIGKVPPAEIPKYFDRADLLVHPSLTEGFGRVIVEALATDTPVLTRAIGDMPSITSNTFVTDQELINNICNYESLYINDADRFKPENLKPMYIEFFKQFR